VETCGRDGPYFVACETVGRDFVGHDEDAEVDGWGPCKGTDGGGEDAFSHNFHLTSLLASHHTINAMDLLSSVLSYSSVKLNHRYVVMSVLSKLKTIGTQKG
jgi:hypothetical protein